MWRMVRGRSNKRCGNHCGRGREEDLVTAILLEVIQSPRRAHLHDVTKRPKDDGVLEAADSVTTEAVNNLRISPPGHINGPSTIDFDSRGRVPATGAVDRHGAQTRDISPSFYLCCDRAPVPQVLEQEATDFPHGRRFV